MRALIVHPSLDVRLLLCQCLAIQWPEIEVVDIDINEWHATVETQGARKADVIIVGEDAVDAMFALLDSVVAQFARTPIVCIGPYGATDQALAVIERGATSYRSMDDVSPASVREIVDVALADNTFDIFENCTERLVFQSEDVLRDDEVDADFVMNNKPVRIRGYTINAKIGEGGMSRVFSAVRDADGQEVVLKVMDGTMMQDPTQLQRFMHEYRIVAQIDSPSVVKIYDQGFTDDHVFIAMERFPGGDLKQRFGKAFPPKEALTMLWQISSALHAIHRLGIVHRDLKPQNIMFRADGSLALLDFGVSTMESMSTALTQSGELVGTPLYMSPEQAQGRSADARSDLYSLGTMFYEMITGKRVFAARSLMMVIHMHATEPPPRLPLPLKSMQELTDKLLAKDPADRFQSAREVMKYVKRRWGSKSSSDSKDLTTKLDAAESGIPAAGGWG